MASQRREASPCGGAGLHPDLRQITAPGRSGRDTGDSAACKCITDHVTSRYDLLGVGHHGDMSSMPHACLALLRSCVPWPDMHNLLPQLAVEVKPVCFWKIVLSSNLGLAVFQWSRRLGKVIIASLWLGSSCVPSVTIQSCPLWGGS